MFGACASHHLPPKEILEANLEAMQEAVSAKVPDAQRAARLNQSGCSGFIASYQGGP